MSYLPRTTGKRFRHDPARFGIFIMGGSNYTPKWDSETSDIRRMHCNRFTLTLPTCTPSLPDTSPEMEAARSLRLEAQPTFRLAVIQARKLREAFPYLAECGIYACTDFQLEANAYARTKGRRVSSGRIAVQLIASPLRRTLSNA